MFGFHRAVHLPRLSASDVWTTLGCTLRVLGDSDRTEDILIAEEILAQRQLRYLLREDALGKGSASLLQSRPELSDISQEELAACPDGSLGHALSRFYVDNQLSTTLYSAEATNTHDEDAAYLMRRTWQSHDVWHVLMNFTVRGHDELLIHAFSLAQTGFPGSVFLIAVGSLKHMLLEARWTCFRRGILESYRRGQQAQELLAVRWEDYLEDPLEEVRQHFGIHPWSTEDHAAMEPWR